MRQRSVVATLSFTPVGDLQAIYIYILLFFFYFYFLMKTCLCFIPKVNTSLEVINFLYCEVQDALINLLFSFSQ